MHCQVKLPIDGFLSVVRSNAIVRVVASPQVKSKELRHNDTQTVVHFIQELRQLIPQIGCEIESLDHTLEVFDLVKPSLQEASLVKHLIRIHDRQV